MDFKLEEEFLNARNVERNFSLKNKKVDRKILLLKIWFPKKMLLGIRNLSSNYCTDY
jgi:hypothetical protein